MANASRDRVVSWVSTQAPEPARVQVPALILSSWVSWGNVTGLFQVSIFSSVKQVLLKEFSDRKGPALSLEDSKR